MKNRYSINSMVNVWSDETKYKNWLKIETCVAAAQKRTVLADWLKEQTINHNSVHEIQKLEVLTKHDVEAFLRYITSKATDPAGYIRHLHFGLTSSDVVDTANSIAMRASCELIEEALNQVIEILSKAATTNEALVCVGRTHGQVAEPITFGFKIAGHLAAMLRCRDRIAKAKNEISICKVAGAVGTYSTVPMHIESMVAFDFKLFVPDHVTQIVPRDRYAVYMTTLAIVASCVENLATEIRNLQRTEIGEVYEGFDSGQQGSSVMPHKKNPILCENLVGLARIVRSNVAPILENVTTWHERDLTHSSVERVLLEQSSCILHFMLFRLNRVLRTMGLNTDKIQQHVEENPQLVASWVKMAFVDGGMSREEAHTATNSLIGTMNYRMRKDPDIEQNLLNVFAEFYPNIPIPVNEYMWSSTIKDVVARVTRKV